MSNLTVTSCVQVSLLWIIEKFCILTGHPAEYSRLYIWLQQ